MDTGFLKRIRTQQNDTQLKTSYKSSQHLQQHFRGPNNHQSYRNKLLNLLNKQLQSKDVRKLIVTTKLDE